MPQPAANHPPACRPRPRRSGACRVLVVDEHPLAREALTAQLERQADLRCVAAVGRLAETLPAVRRHRPDLVLLDLTLGDGEAIRLIRQLRRAAPRARIVALSLTNGGLACGRALQAGAAACVSKDQTAAQIMATLRRVSRGEPILPVAAPAAASAVDHLSDRQFQILRLIGAGRSVRQMAATLGLSHKTVETHRARLREKLALPDARALLRFAVAWRSATRE